MFEAATVSEGQKFWKKTLGETEGFKFISVKTNGMEPGWWYLEEGKEPQKSEPIRELNQPVKGYPDDPDG
jgi:endo-1,4-beta-D-glucanase Y